MKLREWNARLHGLVIFRSLLDDPAVAKFVDLTDRMEAGLTLEAREKLARIRPKNLGQAGRIPGVSPSDVAQLSIALAAKK